jgi:hypothetical protein
MTRTIGRGRYAGEVYPEKSPAAAGGGIRTEIVTFVWSEEPSPFQPGVASRSDIFTATLALGETVLGFQALTWPGDGLMFGLVAEIGGPGTGDYYGVIMCGSPFAPVAGAPSYDFLMVVQTP